jgi:hypothetical protein
MPTLKKLPGKKKFVYELELQKIDQTTRLDIFVD